MLVIFLLIDIVDSVAQMFSKSSCCRFVACGKGLTPAKEDVYIMKNKPLTFCTTIIFNVFSRDHGCERFLSRSSDNEEVTSSKTDPIVCCVYTG